MKEMLSKDWRNTLNNCIFNYTFLYSNLLMDTITVGLISKIMSFTGEVWSNFPLDNN